MEYCGNGDYQTNSLFRAGPRGTSGYQARDIGVALYNESEAERLSRVVERGLTGAHAGIAARFCLSRGRPLGSPVRFDLAWPPRNSIFNPLFQKDLGPDKTTPMPRNLGGELEARTEFCDGLLTVLSDHRIEQIHST